jgi:hypothetical protein
VLGRRWAAILLGGPKGDVALAYDEQEQIEITRAEKLLAFGLVLFLLIGGLWVMNRAAEIPVQPDYDQMQQEYGLASLREELGQFRQDWQRAHEAYQEDKGILNQARVEYEFRREEYRTALDAGIANAQKLAAYEEARRKLAVAEQELGLSEQVLKNQAARLAEVEQGFDAKQEQFYQEWGAAQNRYEFQLFMIRFVFAGLTLVLSVLLWQRMRQKRSRYLVIGTSVLGFGILQLVFLLGFYAWHFLQNYAQLLISVAGTLVTVAGLVALRRYVFNFERLARMRLHRSQCPYCGFACVGAYCPSCGKQALSACDGCGNLRPILLPVCPACGAGRESEG